MPNEVALTSFGSVAPKAKDTGAITKAKCLTGNRS